MDLNLRITNVITHLIDARTSRITSRFGDKRVRSQKRHFLTDPHLKIVAIVTISWINVVAIKLEITIIVVAIITIVITSHSSTLKKTMISKIIFFILKLYFLSQKKMVVCYLYIYFFFFFALKI